jgi:GT2 family glycosyltransferase
MESRMDISVVIPTLGRIESLKNTLHSLEEQTLPRERFEVIVVDNSRQGEAREVIENYISGSEINIRYCHEPVPGKSRAMKKGIREARGEFIAATDDDCLPSEGWLQATLDGFRNEPEDVYCITGKVLPLPGSRTTDMYTIVGLKRTRRKVYRGCLDRARAGTIGNGSNATYRRRAFEEFGFFLYFLGPGTRSQSGEETEFFYRLLKEGKKIVFIPDSVVYHNPERSEKENRCKERGSQYSLGIMYSYYLIRGDILAGLLFLLRLVGIPILSLFMYLRELIIPKARVYFPCRPDCLWYFILGFGSHLTNLRMINREDRPRDNV